MMKEKDQLVRVRFSYQERDDMIDIELPAGTCFMELDGHLYALGYLIPQKPGYAYLVRNHLCGGGEHLYDYLPEGADQMEIRVFGIPQIMV